MVFPPWEQLGEHCGPGSGADLQLNQQKRLQRAEQKFADKIHSDVGGEQTLRFFGDLKSPRSQAIVGPSIVATA
jgi:hypothetical protein